jgi:hypothetical protein
MKNKWQVVTRFHEEVVATFPNAKLAYAHLFFLERNLKAVCWKVVCRLKHSPIDD